MTQQLITFCLPVASMNERSEMIHDCIQPHIKKGWVAKSIASSIWQHDLLYVTVLFEKA